MRFKYETDFGIIRLGTLNTYDYSIKSSNRKSRHHAKKDG